MTIAVCPGSYDPITAGHLDVIQRCTHLFDEVHVLVAINAAKTPLFSAQERVNIIQEAVQTLSIKQIAQHHSQTHENGWPMPSKPRMSETSDELAIHSGRIVVASTSGLITDYCAQVGASVIVKGLRQNGDYEAELGMALVNRKLAGIETMFLPADPILAHVSSSVVKDVARHGGNVTGMVPDNVIPLLNKLFAIKPEDPE